MESKRVFNFDQEGVTVTLPDQARRRKAISLPVDPVAKMPANPGGFQPHRVVINVAVVDEDKPDEYLQEMDPPFELRVRYTRGDLEKAQKSGGELKLAFWDGSQWVVFTQEKHRFELQPADQGEGGGFGVAYISHWGDPNIGWGK